MRADLRYGAGHRRQGHRQPHPLHPQHGHDAAVLRGLTVEAASVAGAMEQTLESGLRTVAIAHGAGSPVGTVEMGDHIVAAIAGSA